MRSIVYSLVILFAGILVGCEDLSGVENPNQPNRDQVLASTEDVEGIAGDTFLNYWQGTMWCDGSMMYSTMADAHSASWGNWGMNDMSSEPRIAWTNTPGYPRSASTEEPWFDQFLGISSAIDVLQNTEEGEVPSARAFANFTQGLMFGDLAARFDRAFNVSNDVDFDAVVRGEEEIPLSPYGEIRSTALARLDEAIRIAQNNDFTIEASQDWVFGTTVTSQNLIQLSKSMKAKILATSARTPEERRNLPWGDIKTFVENGMEANGYEGPFGETGYPGSPRGFQPVGDDGGTQEFDCQKTFANSTTWARADYKTIGPADTSGRYQDWLDTPQNQIASERKPFVTETPDARIQGDGALTAGKYMSPDPSAPEQSFVAFPPDRGVNHYSDYIPTRFAGFGGPSFGGSQSGPMTHTTKAEMDLLKAEAILHSLNGNASGVSGTKSDVAQLINNTRVENGELSPAEASDPVGSMADAPDPLRPDDASDGDATLWSMLKYEHTIETMQTSAGLNYYTKRGWGDLPEGTPLHMPIPADELNTLGLQQYTFGGVDGRCSAGNPTDCIQDTGGGSSANSTALDPDAVRGGAPAGASVKK